MFALKIISTIIIHLVLIIGIIIDTGREVGNQAVWSLSSCKPGKFVTNIF
jgi:hypothetical protein